MMKVLIFADLEGASGIENANMIESSDPIIFDQARASITADVNAAARGLRKAGATQIDVFDGHGQGGNLIVEELLAGINHLGGGWMANLRQMIETDQIKTYDAFVLLGQHACQGTPNGFLSHTNTGVSALKLNGKFVGEAPQIAWLAGYFGVSTLMVVGDDAVAREAAALLPGIKTIVVKESESRAVAHCIPTDEALAHIEEAAYERLSHIETLLPFLLPGPINVEIIFAMEEAADLLAGIVNFQKIDERTIHFLAKDFLEAFFAYHSCRPAIQASYQTMFLAWFKNQENTRDLLDKFNAILLEKFRDTTNLFPIVEYEIRELLG